jgi:methyltransferase
MFPGGQSSASFGWLFAILILQRVLELLLCRRNRRALHARGGKEFHRETYPVVVALHVLFLLSLSIESYPWRIPLDLLTFGCLAALLPVTGLRYWAIASLGENWTTRIVVVPGEPVKRSGPYRFLRHPNYLVMVLEFILIPLLLRAPVTLVVFSLCNMWVLRLRIRLEEKALRDHTDYEDKFPGSRLTVNG